MKLDRLFAVAGLAVIGIAYGTAASAASTTFSDSTFPAANYSTALSILSDPSNTYALSICASCGVAGSSALEIMVGFPTGGGVYNSTNAFAIVNSTFAYDPATQGAIKTIDASVDKDFSIDVNLLYGNTFRPVIEQGGNLYAAAISGPNLQGPGSSGFNTIAATGLTAASFLEIDPTTGAFGAANPDFAGGPMLFGLEQFLGASAMPDTHADLVFDNLSITLNSAVPEPSTWAVMLVGFGVAVIRACRRGHQRGPALRGDHRRRLRRACRLRRPNARRLRVARRGFGPWRIDPVAGRRLQRQRRRDGQRFSGAGDPGHGFALR